MVWPIITIRFCCISAGPQVASPCFFWGGCCLTTPSQMFTSSGLSGGALQTKVGCVDPPCCARLSYFKLDRRIHRLRRFRKRVMWQALQRVTVMRSTRLQKRALSPTPNPTAAQAARMLSRETGRGAETLRIKDSAGMMHFHTRLQDPSLSANRKCCKVCMDLMLAGDTSKALNNRIAWVLSLIHI